MAMALKEADAERQVPDDAEQLDDAILTSPAPADDNKNQVKSTQLCTLEEESPFVSALAVCWIVTVSGQEIVNT